jgi:hypothetical protein
MPDSVFDYKKASSFKVNLLFLFGNHPQVNSFSEWLLKQLKSDMVNALIKLIKRMIHLYYDYFYCS